MRTRTHAGKTKIVLLIGFSGVVLCSGPAPAANFTTVEYTESRRSFSWVFEVDDRPFLPTPFLITPDDAPDPNTGQKAVRWKPQFQWRAFLGDQPPEFQAFGQHTSRFHDEDTAQGNPFSSGFLAYALINKTNAGFEALFQDKDPDHPAIGGPHKDLYSLFWTRANANSDVKFEFKGRHVGKGTPIAEPASLTLLGLGLAALALGARRATRQS